MDKIIFRITANALSYISCKTGLTYNEINVIVYYFGIPFTWLCILDKIFSFHYLKIAFVIFMLGFIVGCKNFRAYSDWLFDKSVLFLNYFNKYGCNYITSSVLICVLLPIVIYTVLIFMM